jgi:hypothetical protein
MLTTLRTSGLALALILCGSLACGGGSSAAPSDAGATTDGGGTFESFYSGVILSYNCQKCHVPGGIGMTEGHLDMSSPAAAYMNLVNQAAQGDVKGSTGVTCVSTGLKRVDPGNATDSLIVQKTSGALFDVVKPPCGSEMPLGCPTKFGCLGGHDVKTMSDWINAGAPAPSSM